jgi:hypothetical protein
MSQRMNEIVNVGAFDCPRWFAEGLTCLIELEAVKQEVGVMSKKEVEAHCNGWLIGNGFAPLRRSQASGDRKAGA